MAIIKIELVPGTLQPVTGGAYRRGRFTSVAGAEVEFNGVLNVMGPLQQGGTLSLYIDTSLLDLS